MLKFSAFISIMLAVPQIQGSLDISNEPVLSADALVYYYDRLDEFVDDNIIYPAKRYIPGLDMTKDQRNLLRAVGKYDRVGVESGHGTGKSASFSWTVIAYLCTRYNTLGMPVKVPCIAPTHHQLYDVLWPEVKRWLAMSRLRPLLTVNSEELWYNGAKDMVFARSRSVVKSENLQGFHAPHLLWVCDEAFGITRMELWETIEGSLTEDDNKILFGGQHSVIIGYCHDAFHKDKAAWSDPHGCLLRFNSEKSPLAKPEYALRIARKYGRNSDVYRVRVLGTEPKGNPDAFIQLQEVEAARNRQVPGSGVIEMGVDCARHGDDLFVVQTRWGNHFYPSFSLPSTDTDQMHAGVIQELRKYRKLTGVTTTARIKIDNTGGWGAGLVDLLLKNRTDNIEVIPVTFGIDVGDKEYADNISIMWGDARDMMPFSEIEDYDRAEFLVEQLCTRRFDLDKYGRIKIEPKKKYKLDYETSPDDADAFVLCASNRAAPKRVFPYYHSTDARDYHGFTIPWDTLEPAKSCVFVVLVAAKDMGIYGALYFWGRESHRLLQYDEIIEANPTAQRIADAIIAKCGCNHTDLGNGKQFITRIYGNAAIFDKAKDIAYYLRRKKMIVHKASAYNPEGALTEVNKMQEHKQITLHPRCEETNRQWTGWEIVNGRPKPGYPLCETLMIVSSELRVLKEISEDEPLKPYGRQKNQIREKLYKDGYKGMYQLMKDGVKVERTGKTGRSRGPNDYLAT
jgi:phage terminase large subunit